MTSATVPVEVVTSPFGIFVAPVGDLITQQLKTYGAHARNELAFLSSLVRPGDRIVDLGAHIGTFAIPLARAVGPTGAVLAVDGNPLAYSLLAANAEINGFGDRIVVRRALLGQVGEFSDKPTSTPGNTGSTRFSRMDTGALPFVSAHSILIEEGFGVPNIIKIDVEGMEGIIVDDLEPILTTAKPICYFEVSPSLRSSGVTPVELGAKFLNLGYRLFRNEGLRNSATDDFRPVELSALVDEKKLFDCLAVPRDHERLDQLLAVCPVSNPA